MVRRLVPALLALTLLAACEAAPEAAPPAVAPDTAALRAELVPLGEAYGAAMLAGDAKALNEFYTDDATVQTTGIPTMIGRAAIMTGDSTAFAAGRPTEWVSTVRTTVPLGPGAVAQTGSWTDATPVAGGNVMRRAGRWVVAVNKGTDGKWRINYLMAMVDSSVTGK